ncbi:MAG: hypothetical protein AAB426_07140 [Myxococcota bacterium]
MRARALTLLTLVAVILVGLDAGAQSKAIRRRMPPTTPPGKEAQAPRPDERKGPDPRLCASRLAILNGERQRYDQQRAELTSVDAEIAELQRRMGELSTRRRDLQQQSDTYERRLSAADSLYKRECSAAEGCDTYVRQVGDLERQTAPLQADLQRVSDDIAVARRDVDSLSRQIEPLQREYGERRCGNMVAGETEQVTIDRCMAIFSDWNRYQADLNRQTARLADLKARYQQSVAELRSLETRATGYRTYMERNCASNRETQVVRDYGRVQRNAEQLGRELDQLVDSVTRLRGVRITIGAE